MTKTQQMTIVLLVLLLAGITLPVFSSPPASAGGLPPRPTSIPTATPTPTTASPTASPTMPADQPAPAAPENGATIVLHVPAPPAALHTVVQWLDGEGAWHDVTGWQGTLNEANFIAWWVSPADVETGPFRWIIYTEDDTIWKASDSFYLPDNGQTTHILLSLAE